MKPAYRQISSKFKHIVNWGVNSWKVKFEDYLISTDKGRLNHEIIHRLLLASYWANKRPIDRINKSIETLYCYGVYHNDKQIGFARIITDWATTYWLCDVVIDEAHRGRGLGKKLIQVIIQSEELKELSGFLGTADAHGLYEQFGFVRNTERFMVRRPD